MPGWVAALIIIAAPFALLSLAYFAVRARLNYILGGALNGRTLRQLIAELRANKQSTPRTISAMTRVYQPSIERDFPEFSWTEFRQKAENLLRSAFASIEAQDAGLLEGGGTDIGADLRAQVELIIAKDREQGLNRHFEDVSIHRTEIVSYERRAGTCTVGLQSAVALREWTERGGALVSGSMEDIRQARYDMQLCYIQNERNMPGRGITGAGLHCPNCGAPIATLGQKVCSYCHMAVSELNIRVWSFTGFRES